MKWFRIQFNSTYKMRTTMYSTMNLVDVAQQLQNQNQMKNDFLASVKSVSFEDGKMNLPNIGSFSVTENQLFQQMDFLNKNNGLRLSRETMRRFKNEAPHLNDSIFNEYFPKSENKAFIRTLGKTSRAFLSERYRPLDNWDLMSAILPTLQEKQLTLRSSNLNDEKLYLKATLPTIQGEVKKGDVVEMGISISNSEIGMGSVRVQPLIYRLICTNGLISNTSMRKYHVGKQSQQFDDVSRFISDETRQQEDKAFWMTVRDLVKNTLTEEFFNEELNKLKEASSIELSNTTPVDAVKNVTKIFSLNQSEGETMLNHLINDGDYSKWGFANAVTALANDASDYSRATYLETIGGEIITLPKNQWSIIDSEYQEEKSKAKHEVEVAT